MSQRFTVTLTQLSYFVECAKTLNMTAASQRLYVAQSAISTAIAHLEEALDTTLFIRQHSKGLVLTSSGEKLLRDTQRMFGFLTDTIDALRSDRNDVRGAISIACFSTLAPFLLPQLIWRLQARHPQLTVDIIEGDYAQNLAALRGGRADISIGYDLAPTEGIVQEVIGTVRPYVLLPIGHRLADSASVRLSALADDPFILLDLPGSSDYFIRVLQSAGVIPKLKHRTSSYETVRSMIATGLGYSILNQRPQTEQTYTGERAKAVEIADDVASLNIVTSSLAQLTLSARARAVIEVVKEIIAEHPGGANSATQCSS